MMTLTVRYSPDVPLPSIETLLESVSETRTDAHEMEDLAARFSLENNMQAAQESARRADARETLARRARANTEPAATRNSSESAAELWFGPASDFL